MFIEPIGFARGAPPAPASSGWRLHQAPTQPVDPEEDAPEHPDEPPVPEPGLPV